METLMILAADYANIAEGGKVNVMGIFRRIKAKSFPARHMQMSLVIKLAAELGEYGKERDITVILCDEDGNELFRSIGKIQVPERKGGLRPEINLIMNFRDLLFPKPGRYDFVVLIDSDHKGSCPIQLVDISSKGE